MNIKSITQATIRPRPKTSVASITIDGPPYAGEVTVTPKAEAQTLPTKNTTLREDITIESIPYREVENEFGTTVIIGG